MGVHAGSAPWTDGFRRMTKKSIRDKGLQWSLTSGWRYRDYDEWDRHPEKSPMRKVKIYNGRYVQVPVDDYQDFIMFHRKDEDLDPDSEIGMYLYNALEKQKDDLHTVEGVGHIARIDYNADFQIMQVSFVTDGAVVAYLRVPKELYSQLAHLAESKQTFIDNKGKERHVLGKVFWDYVRVRGQKKASKYSYEYTTNGVSKGQRFQQSAMVSAKEVSLIKTDKSKAQLIDSLARNFLTGGRKKEFDALESYEQKEEYLSKVGII